MSRRLSSAYRLLDSIVDKCLRHHEGGEAFFDNLDKDVRDKRIVNLLLELGVSSYGDIVVSGRFGAYFYARYAPLFRNVIVVPGKLRDASTRFSLRPLHEHVRGRDFVFVDDSFYSGTTRDRIRREVRRLGGDVVQSFVVYDGSRIRDPSVLSLFRYY